MSSYRSQLDINNKKSVTDSIRDEHCLPAEEIPLPRQQKRNQVSCQNIK